MSGCESIYCSDWQVQQCVWQRGEGEIPDRAAPEPRQVHHGSIQVSQEDPVRGESSQDRQWEDPEGRVEEHGIERLKLTFSVIELNVNNEYNLI